MTTLELVKWVHLLAAAVWTGGLIVLAFLVTAIRSATDDRTVLQATARRFGVVSWTAMAVAIATGLWQLIEWPLTKRELEHNGTLIILAIVLTLVHQFTAKRTGPAVRGILQLLIIVVSIGIYGAAVALI